MPFVNINFMACYEHKKYVGGVFVAICCESYILVIPPLLTLIFCCTGLCLGAPDVHVMFTNSMSVLIFSAPRWCDRKYGRPCFSGCAWAIQIAVGIGQMSRWDGPGGFRRVPEGPGLTCERARHGEGPFSMGNHGSDGLNRIRLRAKTGAKTGDGTKHAGFSTVMDLQPCVSTFLHALGLPSYLLRR